MHTLKNALFRKSADGNLLQSYQDGTHSIQIFNYSDDTDIFATASVDILLK